MSEWDKNDLATGKAIVVGSKYQPFKANIPKTVLRISPYVWAKLSYYRSIADTEIGGFGILADEDDLYMEDFMTVKQDVTSITIEFDDESVADYYNDMLEGEYEPHQFGRIWVHTHPGTGAPTPSSDDEETFERVFGGCDWAIMLILAGSGSSYTCILQYNKKPAHRINITMEIDWTREFYGSDHEEWDTEFQQNIHEVSYVTGSSVYYKDVPKDKLQAAVEKAWDDNYSPLYNNRWENDLDEEIKESLEKAASKE